MVSIDIACLDQEAANRPDIANRWSPDCRELKLSPVVGTRRTALPGLNADHIGAIVPVKIGNRKLWARSDRSSKAV